MVGLLGWDAVGWYPEYRGLRQVLPALWAGERGWCGLEDPIFERRTLAGRAATLRFKIQSRYYHPFMFHTSIPAHTCKI